MILYRFLRHSRWGFGFRLPWPIVLLAALVLLPLALLYEICRVLAWLLRDVWRLTVWAMTRGDGGGGEDGDPPGEGE